MQARGEKITQSSKIWIFSLLGLLLLIMSSMAAYHYIFRRAGEEAAALIPADASVVATLDVSPGPDQVALFGRIAKSMKMEAVQDPIKSSIATSKNGTTFVDEIIPHLRNSYAAGIWMKPNAKPTDAPELAGLASVDSAATVEAIAAKHANLAHQGDLNYYSITSEKICVAFIRDYLVVSNRPEPLARILAVSRGQEESVASLATFQQARTQLPASANYMMFGNMTKATAWSKKLETTTLPGKPSVSMSAHVGDPNLKLKGWATFAATLRNEGVETVWKLPYDSSYPGAKLIDTITPIDKKLFGRLPAGAYGLMVLGQPGAYYEAKDDSFGLTPEEKKSMNDALAAFEKETGLNLEKDLVGGLKGNLALAVYPGREATGLPDGLILLDDSNGADPAAMVDKIRSVIVKECKKNDTTPPKFTSVSRDGAVIWSLDEKTQSALREGSGIEPDPHSDSPSDHRPRHNSASSGEQKKLLFAAVGKSVLIASSESMLNRAITAYNTGSATLATDPAYMPLLNRLTPNTQNLFMLATPDVMEQLKSTLARNLTDPHGPKAEDFARLFGTRGNGLVFSQGHEGQTLTGSLFIPLNYEAAIHLANLSNQKKGVR